MSRRVAYLTPRSVLWTLHNLTRWTFGASWGLMADEQRAMDKAVRA